MRTGSSTGPQHRPAGRKPCACGAQWYPVPRSNPTEKTMKSGRILCMKYTNSCVTFFLRWVFDHFLQIFLTFLQVVSLTLPKVVSHLFFCKEKCYKESVFQLVFKMVLRQYHEDGFWPFLADSILLFLKIIFLNFFEDGFLNFRSLFSVDSGYRKNTAATYLQQNLFLYKTNIKFIFYLVIESL